MKSLNSKTFLGIFLTLGLLLSIIVSSTMKAHAEIKWHCRIVSPVSRTTITNSQGIPYEGISVFESSAKNEALNRCAQGQGSFTVCSNNLPMVCSQAQFPDPPPKPPQARSCTAFKDGHLDGQSIKIKAGEALSSLGSMNDEISSVFNSPNCRLAVYEHVNFEGYLMHLNPGPSEMLGIPDRISSMRCECQ